MKKKIIIAVSALVVTICVALTCTAMFTTAFIPKSVFFAKIYQGNRITADLNIYVNGVAAKITKEDGGDYEIKDTEYGAQLLHRANEEDTYEYNLLINGKYKMKIYANHRDWWETMDGTVMINISPNSNSCFISEKCDYTTDNPKYRVKKNEKSKFVKDISEGIEFYIGRED